VLSYDLTGPDGVNTFHEIVYEGGLGEIDPLLEAERALGGRPPEAMAAIYSASFDKFYDIAPDNSLAFTQGDIQLVGWEDGVAADLGGGVRSLTQYISQIDTNGFFVGLNNIDPLDSPDRIADFLGSRTLHYEYDAGTSYTCDRGVTCPDDTILSFSGTATFNRAASTLAVPEPAAWALMILGFGLTGAALRRRSRLVCQPAT
jgi:hypothetical protein